ncbi:hypothetical protein BC832DRAFT_594769 [Gaertneriomyces semiglobifer]|nr:hypothetical protein BC832DRAFT_594769 [Gaertneriomyces semiglobifer]
MASPRRPLLLNHYLPLLVILGLLLISLGLTIGAISQGTNWVQQDVEIETVTNEPVATTHLNIGIWSWCIADLPSIFAIVIFPGQDPDSCIDIDICNFISNTSCTLLAVGKGFIITSIVLLVLAIIATILLLLFLLPTIALPLLVACTIITFFFQIALDVFFRILRSRVRTELRDIVERIAGGLAGVLEAVPTDSRFKSAYGLMVASSVIVGLAMILSILQGWFEACGRRSRKRWSSWKGVGPARTAAPNSGRLAAMHSEMTSEGTLV